jgi:hypothetical protein
MTLDIIRGKCAVSNLLSDLINISVEYLVEDIDTNTEKYTLFDGKKIGLYEGWYSNGQLRYRFNYSDGKKYGLYEEWYENGQSY